MLLSLSSLTQRRSLRQDESDFIVTTSEWAAIQSASISLICQGLAASSWDQSPQHMPGMVWLGAQLWSTLHTTLIPHAKQSILTSGAIPGRLCLPFYLWICPWTASNVFVFVLIRVLVIIQPILPPSWDIIGSSLPSSILVDNIHAILYAIKLMLFWFSDRISLAPLFNVLKSRENTI